MRSWLLLSAVACFAASAFAADLPPDQVIQKFAAKEAQFRKARESYTYRQSVKVEELDGSGNVEGKWEEVQDVTFGPNKEREEKVIYAPLNTLSHILLTPKDLQDLRSVQPFVLTTDELPKYDINYDGKEKLDEIDCYKFSVKPKKLVKNERYFEGDIWVDDRDLQIVKTFGKGVGQQKKGEEDFPRFETYREQIDGKYWFPTYTHANDTLHFRDSDQRIRMTVKYENYKRFGSESSITFGDEVPDSKK